LTTKRTQFNGRIENDKLEKLKNPASGPVKQSAPRRAQVLDGHDGQEITTKLKTADWKSPETCDQEIKNPGSPAGQRD
jgi:hypothetical protein